MQYLAEHARLAYYPVGAIMVDTDAGHDGRLYVIHREPRVDIARCWLGRTR